MAQAPKRRALRLLGLATVIGGVVAIELAAGPLFVPRPPQSLPAFALKDGHAIAPIERPSISAFSEVLERPLFARSRRPPPPSVESAVKRAPKAETLDLVGIILSPTGRVALLRSQQSEDVLHVVEGQHVAGWEIRTINSTEVVLGRGDFSELLKINDTRRRAKAPHRTPRGSTKSSEKEGEPAGTDE
jgi:hypothetical protein